VAGTLNFKHQTSPKPMYASKGKVYIDASASRRHTLLVSEEGNVWACGENKNGVLGNTTKKFGMSKQWGAVQKLKRQRPLKWFPSQTIPSGFVKSGSDFKITQVVSTDTASFAREAAPSEAIDMIWGLKKTIRGVEKLIDEGGGAKFLGNLGLMELRSYMIEQKAMLTRKFVGTVLAWGSGSSGQLGLGGEDKHNNVQNIYTTHSDNYKLMEYPTPIPGLLGKNVRTLSAGSSHVLALCETGMVYAWGKGRDGRLGLGDYEDRWEPCLIEKLSSKGRAVCVIGAGAAHSIACTEGGKRVYTWGRGANGRLGSGRHLNKKSPVEITHNFPSSFKEKNTFVTQAALGGAHSLLLCERIVESKLTNPWGIETRLYAFGCGNHGQLGNDGVQDSAVPVKVQMPKWERVVSVEAGKSHSCCVTIYGQLFTWGKGWFGVLGHGDDQLRIAPKLVETSSNMFLKCCAGEMHTVAITLKRGGMSRRSIDKVGVGEGSVESRRTFTPPVYLGLPRCNSLVMGRWRNAKCANYNDYTWNGVKAKMGLRAKAETGAIKGIHDGDGFEEEKKTEGTAKGKAVTTWRDLPPEVWYKPSNKLERYYKCESAGFGCLSYHCARMCINGLFQTKRKMLVRAEARLESAKKMDVMVQNLREEGHTQGDIKRFCKQFKRREKQQIVAIDSQFTQVSRKVENLDSDLVTISECSLTRECRLMQCIAEEGEEEEEQGNKDKCVVNIQRVTRGGRGRRRAAERRVEIDRIQKDASKKVFKETVLEKVEKRALTHKRKELRKRILQDLKIADVESVQYRWYCKLQVALQAIEQQKLVFNKIFASGGVKDPNNRFCDDVLEPSCRSVAELRGRQRRHPRIERLAEADILRIGKANKLGLYCEAVEGNRGEFDWSDVSVFSKLLTIQDETKKFFERIEGIKRGLDKADSDEAHWKDPATMVSYTMQEINRNRGRIKESRMKLEEELKNELKGRKEGRKRRASLARVEGLYILLGGTRGRQRGRIEAKRRRSMNLKEARVDKNVFERDLRDIEMMRAVKDGVRESVNIPRDLMGLNKEGAGPPRAAGWNLEDLLSDEWASSKKGIKEWSNFLLHYRVGTMCVDTYGVLEQQKAGRSISICAPERYLESRNLWYQRREDIEKVWEAADDRHYPPFHPSDLMECPRNKRSIYPRRNYELAKARQDK